MTSPALNSWICSELGTCGSRSPEVHFASNSCFWSFLEIFELFILPLLLPPPFLSIWFPCTAPREVPWICAYGRSATGFLPLSSSTGKYFVHQAQIHCHEISYCQSNDQQTFQQQLLLSVVFPLANKPLFQIFKNTNKNLVSNFICSPVFQGSDLCQQPWTGVSYNLSTQNVVKNCGLDYEQVLFDNNLFSRHTKRFPQYRSQWYAVAARWPFMSHKQRDDAMSSRTISQTNNEQTRWFAPPGPPTHFFGAILSKNFGTCSLNLDDCVNQSFLLVNLIAWFLEHKGALKEALFLTSKHILPVVLLYVNAFFWVE